MCKRSKGEYFSNTNHFRTTKSDVFEILSIGELLWQIIPNFLTCDFRNFLILDPDEPFSSNLLILFTIVYVSRLN